MITLQFTKANMSSIPLVEGYNSHIVINVNDNISPKFPDQFYLQNPNTGVKVLMHFLPHATEVYEMDNEGWDGEISASLYGGIAPNGKKILVELYTSLQY